MKKHIGVIGLSPMGKNFALNLLDNFTVSIYNRTSSKTDALSNYDFVRTYTLADFVNSLPKPKIIFLIVKSSAVSNILKDILPLLEKEDIICDFGNTEPTLTDDHVRMIKENFAEKNDVINFLSVGISGGTKGARSNGGLMISGSQKSFSYLESVFAKTTNSFQYFGPKYSTGHFVKFVHNAIEYSMMNVLAEINEILCCYEKNANACNFLTQLNNNHAFYLLDCLLKVLKHKQFQEIKNVLEMKGSGKWILQRFAGDIRLRMLENAIEQRNPFFSENDQSDQVDNISYFKSSDFSNDFEFTKIKNLLFYVIKLCYYEGLNIFIKTDQKELILPALQVWENGCIISGCIVTEIRKEIGDCKENYNFDDSDKKNILKTLKSLVLFAIDNNIPCQQFSSILNDNRDMSFQRRVLAGMRDYFGQHGVGTDKGWEYFEWE